jgi:hypothetical protein
MNASGSGRMIREAPAANSAQRWIACPSPMSRTNTLIFKLGTAFP